MIALGAIDPQFSHRQEVVVVRAIEVYHACRTPLNLPIGLVDLYLYAITDEPVLLLIGLHETLGGHMCGHLVTSLRQLLVVDPGIQFLECLAEPTTQKDITTRLTTKGAYGAQYLFVIGKDCFPSELITHKLGGALLYHRIFRIIV